MIDSNTSEAETAPLISSALKIRCLLYFAWLTTSAFLFWRPITELIAYTGHNNDANYVLLIPFVSAGLILFERRTVFHRVSFDFFAAGALMAAAGAAWGILLKNQQSFTPIGILAGYTLSLVLLTVAGFVLFFGRSAAWSARFSLLFMFLAIPLPDPLLQPIVHFLQKGSAEITQYIFELTRVPFIRQGLIFDLGAYTIEIAEECSGIHSSIAILILALLAAHFCLSRFWRQSLFVIASILIMLVKNGIRIAALTLLAMYVNPGFLSGRLHHQGGIVFFLVGLLLLVPIFEVLRRTGKPKGSRDAEFAAAGSAEN
jgi:exosortase